MADAKDFLPMVRLNGDNFAVWKFQIRLIFGSRDLLIVVNRTEKRPDGEAVDATIAT